jgi:hypothetical protein
LRQVVAELSVQETDVVLSADFDDAQMVKSANAAVG